MKFVKMDPAEENVGVSEESSFEIIHGDNSNPNHHEGQLKKLIEIIPASSLNEALSGETDEIFIHLRRKKQVAEGNKNPASSSLSLNKKTKKEIKSKSKTKADQDKDKDENKNSRFKLNMEKEIKKLKTHVKNLMKFKSRVQRRDDSDESDESDDDESDDSDDDEEDNECQVCKNDPVQNKGLEKTVETPGQDKNSENKDLDMFLVFLVLLVGLIVGFMFHAVFISRLGGKLRVELQDTIKNTIQEITVQSLQETIKKSIQENLKYSFTENFPDKEENYEVSKFTSCSDAMEILPSPRSIKKSVSIYPDENNKKKVDVLCDFDVDGGGWTIIQKRSFGPKYEFDRNWNDYVEGFGSVDGNFWLGLENIRALTKKGDQELRIELEDFEGRKRYAKYSSFSISDAFDFYRLTISGFSGDAGDSMTGLLKNNGRKFSTRDKDNDKTSFNCAEDRGGGWWFNHCGGHGFLNGPYRLKGENVPNWAGIMWMSWKGDEYSLAKTEMKIRKRK